jgi:hypothetical protein
VVFKFSGALSGLCSLALAAVPLVALLFTAAVSAAVV